MTSFTKNTETPVKFIPVGTDAISNDKYSSVFTDHVGQSFVYTGVDNNKKLLFTEEQGYSIFDLSNPFIPAPYNYFILKNYTTGLINPTLFPIGAVKKASMSEDAQYLTLSYEDNKYNLQHFKRRASSDIFDFSCYYGPANTNNVCMTTSMYKAPIAFATDNSNIYTAMNFGRIAKDGGTVGRGEGTEPAPVDSGSSTVTIGLETSTSPTGSAFTPLAPVDGTPIGGTGTGSSLAGYPSAAGQRVYQYPDKKINSSLAYGYGKIVGFSNRYLVFSRPDGIVVSDFIEAEIDNQKFFNLVDLGLFDPLDTTVEVGQVYIGTTGDITYLIVEKTIDDGGRKSDSLHCYYITGREAGIRVQRLQGTVGFDTSALSVSDVTLTENINWIRTADGIFFIITAYYEEAAVPKLNPICLSPQSWGADLFADHVVSLDTIGFTAELPFYITVHKETNKLYFYVGCKNGACSLPTVSVV